MKSVNAVVSNKNRFKAKYVSRGGLKLEHALNEFGIDVVNKLCADFGSSTGGFVDCLLRHDAKKVYSVDVAYGELDWNLRNDPRVVVLERTNAMHVRLPEKVDLITIDVGWTKQETILPNATHNLKPDGIVVTLIKPHYEVNAEQQKYRGTLPPEQSEKVLQQVLKKIEGLGLKIIKTSRSPINGRRGENIEYLAMLQE